VEHEVSDGGRRRWLGIAAVALAVPAIALGAAWIPGHAKTGPTAPTALQPGLAAAGREFQVPSPMTLIGSAPIFPDVPACNPDEVRASAEGQPSTYGVLGVVRLEALKTYADPDFPRHQWPCRLPVEGAPTALLDGDGNRLPVTTETTSSAVPTRTGWNAARTGKAVVGFSWLGFYCGPAPSVVELPLFEPAGTSLKVAYDGPSPPCRNGRDESRLLEGSFGYPGEAVQPPPPAFKHLRLSLRVGDGTDQHQIGEIFGTLSTESAIPVYLSPCPGYGGDYEASTRSHGGFGTEIPHAQLDCADTAIEVSDDAPYTFRIPPTKFHEEVPNDPSFIAAHGSVVRLSIVIAGIPSARLDVPVP
jgi:hypothetical protein